jgi:hypothetical protein
MNDWLVILLGFLLLAGGVVFAYALCRTARLSNEPRRYTCVGCGMDKLPVEFPPAHAQVMPGTCRKCKEMVRSERAES